MLTPRQVAERLNCSLANVYKLLADSELPSVPVGAGGAGLRVDEADFEQFIERRKKGRRMESPPWPEKTKPVQLKHIRL